MALSLKVIEGRSLGQELTIHEAGALIIGRSKQAQFALIEGDKLDRRISNRHALIEYNDPRCRIHCISDKNRMLINGEIQNQADLKHGDRITLGRTILEVSLTPLEELKPLPLPEATVLLQPSPARMDQSGTIPIVESKCAICRQPTMTPRDLLCLVCQSNAAILPQPIPQYQLVKKVGQDHLGSTYLGIHPDRRRVNLIRTIVPNGILSTAASLAYVKWMREIEEVQHRYLIRIENSGISNGVFYQAMKIYRGRDLIRFIKKKPPTLQQSIAIVCQILSSLHRLHESGVVHGDLKPSNVFMKIHRDEVSVRLMDVGLDYMSRRLQIPGCILPSEEKQKPIFRAPEQMIDLSNTSPASDQYAAAAILYYLVSGHRIYKPSGETRDLLIQKLRDEPIPLREYRPSLPHRLISTIHCALARDPKRRFADVRQFRRTLKGFLK